MITATAAIWCHARIAAGYRSRMPPRLSGRQLGLFDNQVGAFSLEELADAVRELERKQPGQTVEEISIPGSLYPIRRRDGRRYFVYNAFLAVSSASAPFATVSIVRPATARLVYGASSEIGKMFGTASGQALVAASRSKVRLPVCGSRFTGFVGGIILTQPTCITFEVSSPGRRTETASAQIGPSVCPGAEVVTGDQVVTDGILARRLGYAFVQFRPLLVTRPG